MSSLTDAIPRADDVEMKLADAFTTVPKDEENAEIDDLFGNENDVEGGDDGEKGTTGSPVSSRQGSEELQQREHLEYDEPEDPADVIHEVKEANIAIPNWPLPRPSDNDHWVIRMPNFVKVDSKPFHPDTYMGPEHDEDEVQHGENLRERSMTIKLKVENTVRWRWGKDEFGQDVRQSNSRVIRWSDGTLSLRLGKELFDINQSIDTSGTAPRGLFSGSQTQTSQSQPDSSHSPIKSQGLTYLISQHKRAQILQSEATITGYMTLRPTGMQSETHRMLVQAVGQKHNKIARLRIAPDPTMDPEKAVAELIKNAAKKSKKKNDEEGYGYGGRKRRSGDRSRRRPTDWSDSEDDDEGLGRSYGDEDEDVAGHRAKKVDAKKGHGEYEEDDFVIADEDDEDGSEGEMARKRKRQPDMDEEVEEDPLDKMEARLEAQERKKKHRKHSEGDADAAAAADDDAMEVESEEEDPNEDVIKVRRTGTGARKKRAIDFEEEEDE